MRGDKEEKEKRKKGGGKSASITQKNWIQW